MSALAHKASPMQLCLGHGDRFAGIQAVERVVSSHVRRLDAALEAALYSRKLAAAAPPGSASTAVTAKLQVRMGRVAIHLGPCG